MTKDIFQILIATGLLVTFIFVLLRFVKYRKTHAEILVDLYKNLGEKDNLDKGKVDAEPKEDFHRR